MTWVKVDDKLHDHPKVQLLLEQGRGDALMLWLLAASWSGDQLSDGVISGFVLARWGPSCPTYAEWLVDVGLWERVDVEGRPHFRFHDWLDYNDSREETLSNRAAKAMRDALHKDHRLKAAINSRDKDRCRYCGTLVNWRSKRGRDAATYDHVTPISSGGRNTIENVVVCCKGCNDTKNKRSVREAGMRLLAPGSLGAPVLDDEHSTTSRSATGSGRVGSGRVSEAAANAAFNADSKTGPDATTQGGAGK